MKVISKLVSVLIAISNLVILIALLAIFYAACMKVAYSDLWVTGSIIDGLYIAGISIAIIYATGKLSEFFFNDFTKEVKNVWRKESTI